MAREPTITLPSHNYSYYSDYYNSGHEYEVLPHQLCNNTNVREFRQVFLPILYSAVFIIGLLGNGLVVYVLVKYRSHCNVTDTYLLNLALSDILFLLTLPLWAHFAATSDWVFGDFMCVMVTSMHILGFYGSIFFMMVMTADRYTAIVHVRPTMAWNRSFRVRRAVVGFVWLISLCASLPTVIFARVTQTSSHRRCNIDYPKGTAWEKFSLLEMNMLGLVLPLSMMVFCYSRIIRTVLTMKSKKKQKSIGLILILVIVFFLFWTPYNIIIFLCYLQLQDILMDCEAQESINMATQWTETIAFSHCCLNPVIYAFASQRFLKMSQRILKQWFPVCFSGSAHSSTTISQREAQSQIF